MEKAKWLDVAVVVLKSVLMVLAALSGDQALGSPLAGLIQSLHPASVLVGASAALPLLATRRYGSSSKRRVARRSAKAKP